MSKALTHQQRLNSIRGLLERSKDKYAEVLPKHLTAERLIRIAIAAASRNPQLLACTPQSLALSLMGAAQLGLEAGSPLGSAYLVPFRNKNGNYEATLIIGYRGLIELARRSGEISMIEAHVVHENDTFTCRFGMEPVLEHEPCWTGEPGDVIAAYAVAKLTDGSTQVEVMTRAQIDAIKNRSRAGRSGPWVSDYPEMARKTVVRRLAKYLPLSVELARALDLDAHAEAGSGTGDIIDIDIPEEMLPEEPTSRNDEVKEALMGQTNGQTNGQTEDAEETGFHPSVNAVINGHGKTAKKVISETWDIGLLEEMAKLESEGKGRQPVMEAISSQLDMAVQASKDDEDDEVEEVQAEVVAEGL